MKRKSSDAIIMLLIPFAVVALLIGAGIYLSLNKLGVID